jgi:LysM repeat protein/3D (Asp-Asp-Asp) domain-containing protein
MKRLGVVATIIVIMAITVSLSLRRSDVRTDDRTEIKHFTHATASIGNLRLHDGQTLHEFYERRIHLHLRSRRQKPTPMEIRVASGTEDRAPFRTGEPLNHTLDANETLEDLSRRYRLSVYQIRKLNNLSPDAAPPPGTKLRIVPGLKPTYRVRPGDTLIAIGKRFGVDHREIVRLNNLPENRHIWAGQKLVMPIAQEHIDAVLAEIERKRREEEARKRRYERQLIARLARQKRAREAEAKQKRKEEARRKRKQQIKEREDRLAKAQKAFKYTGSKKFKHKIHVIATAYTSHRSQTDSTPFLAAWNNRIRPGMKIIAVSPDLIRKYGLTNGMRVKIGGLPGTYVVRDKMNPRLRNHIDIYMGTDRRRALRWGRRRVVLYW